MLPEIFVYCTIIGGGALLLQVALMFLGFDELFEGAEGDIDLGIDMESADGGDASGFWLMEMISLRTLSAAATFFGLAGWISLRTGQSTLVALVIALVAGYAALYSVYWAFKQIFKLETSGNLDVRNTVGRPAKVYIPIPAGREGAGKVQMKVQDRLVEYQAVTEDADPLRTGDQVTVVDLVSSDTLLVERVAEPEAAEPQPAEA